MYLPHSHTMKLVYELRSELRDDPQWVADAQALTLNKDKPLMGLKGAAGLFGSDEWWASTRNGRLRRAHVSGVITRTYWAGQDSRPGDQVNSFVLRLDDGAEAGNSIYVNDPRDTQLFKPGCRVSWAAVLDPLKNPNHGLVQIDGVGYSSVVLEMAVSLKPEA